MIIWTDSGPPSSATTYPRYLPGCRVSGISKNRYLAGHWSSINHANSHACTRSPKYPPTSSRLVFVFLPPVKPICGDSIGSNLPTILCPQSRYLPPRIVERRRCVDDSAVDTTLSPGTADSNLDRSRSVSGKMWLDWWSASRDQCHRKTGKGERIGIYK